jgi:hypothetical protein
MAGKDFDLIVTELKDLVARVKDMDLGYPAGVNEVRDGLSSPENIPAQLEPLYRSADGLSFPDVCGGYFLDSASWVASAQSRGEPASVAGNSTMPVRVFGSDGGGGRFVLRLDDGSVYYLPSSGAVREGVYDHDDVAVPRRLAETVLEFMWKLKDDVDAFVRDDQGHEGMVS